MTVALAACGGREAGSDGGAPTTIRRSAYSGTRLRVVRHNPVVADRMFAIAESGALPSDSANCADFATHTVAYYARRDRLATMRERDGSRDLVRKAYGTERTESAVDSNLEGVTHLAHPLVAQSTETLDQDADRDAFHRVEVGYARPRNRVLAGFEPNLARETSDRRRARGHERAPEPRDGGVT
jgi:hypothetical protein